MLRHLSTNTHVLPRLPCYDQTNVLYTYSPAYHVMIKSMFFMGCSVTMVLTLALLEESLFGTNNPNDPSDGRAVRIDRYIRRGEDIPCVRVLCVWELCGVILTLPLSLPLSASLCLCLSLSLSPSLPLSLPLSVLGVSPMSSLRDSISLVAKGPPLTKRWRTKRERAAPTWRS